LGLVYDYIVQEKDNLLRGVHVTLLEPSAGRRSFASDFALNLMACLSIIVKMRRLRARQLQIPVHCQNLS
jgi:hypothetical protein